jgi:hypothetical protein
MKIIGEQPELLWLLCFDLQVKSLHISGSASGTDVAAQPLLIWQDPVDRFPYAYRKLFDSL